jgi:hypothetical protein
LALSTDDLPTPAARELEGQFQNAADLEVVVLHRVGHFDVAARKLFARLPAEIHPAGQLAHHQYVNALELLGFERRRVGERRMDLHRPQVGEDPQPFAQREQALLGPDPGLGIVVLRRADGAEQNRIGGLTRRQRPIRQCRSVPIDRLAAD